VMTVYLLHGYNVSRPENTVGQCIAPLLEMGYQPELIEYGHVGLLNLRPRNETAAMMLRSIVKPGDALITHSNGAAIAYEAALKYGLHGLSALMMFNPALDQKIIFPRDTASRIVVAHNATDAPVLVSRLWRRITQYSPLSLAYGEHLWGAAGRFGFEKRNRYHAHIDMSKGSHGVKGHSGQFRPPEITAYWTRRIMQAAKLESLTRVQK